MKQIYRLGVVAHKTTVKSAVYKTKIEKNLKSHKRSPIFPWRQGQSMCNNTYRLCLKTHGSACPDSRRRRSFGLPKANQNSGGAADRCKPENSNQISIFFARPIRYTILFFTALTLSCTRAPNIPDHLDDDFLPGASEGLYRIRDLTMILDEKAAKSKKQTGDLSSYVSQKEKLYANRGLEANIHSLEGLLRIRTAEKGTKVKISSGMKNIYIDPKIPFLNEYELLDYRIINPRTKQQKVLKKLLGKIRDFKGFPNTDYYILPHFEGNYLILYKLAPVDKIPYDELPLAKRVGNLLAVPLTGYQLEYCKAVKFLDSNQRETLKSRSLCKGVKHDPHIKYIRLRAHGKQVFQYLKKLDFFQRDFFNGKWLHYRTLVRSPSDRNWHIKHTDFQSAYLVEFRPSIGKMDVMEVSGLKEGDSARILFIPVKWTDYEIARDSENLNKKFSERLKKDTHEISRPYLEIKFDELVTNEFEHQEEGGKSLKSVVITEDYISFDIEITSKGKVAYMMKYAFKRYVENPEYTEKRWFKQDHFLFFRMSRVKRKYYEDLTDHSLMDENRFERAIRFDPKSKKILWYFSKQTSHIKWVRDLGREAVDLVNKSLKSAGRGSNHEIELVLDKTGADKEVGDIRYNVLNLILSEGETSEQFNLGWNIANPMTGEAVSATANVWVNQILKDYIYILRNYIRFHVYPPAWKMKPFSRDTANFIHEAKITNLQCGDLSRPPLSVTPFLHEKINSVCKDVPRFIQKEKGTFHPKESSLQDGEIVRSCVQKLARVKILQSIVHSILHSLGMRDILSASVDQENFYNHNEMKELFGRSDFEMTTAGHPDLPQYSSVMDEMNFEYPILSVPGKMDTAALRFIYFDKVEKENGELLPVPSGADKDPNNPQKSILSSAGGEKLKEHKVCGWDSRHPLFCKGFDYGVSPLEITSNDICKAHNSVVSERNRHDGKKIDEKQSRTAVVHNIKAMYNKWADYRDNILAGKNKSVLDYSFLNRNHVEEYSQIMETLKNHPDIKPYYEIRRLVFDYFKRVVFAPAKHCIYKEVSDEDGKSRYKAVPLEVIEKKILRQHPENSDKENEVFMSCESQIVKDWAGKDKKLVTEVGFFGKDRRYFIRPNKKTDPVDEESAFQNKLDSIFSLLSGTLNEPDLGAEYYRELQSYITEGIDLNPYIDRSAMKDPNALTDIQLKRVLSYTIDTMEGISTGEFDNLWFSRWRGMEKHRENLNRPHSSIENLQLFSSVFSYQAFSQEVLKDYTESAPTHPGLHDAEIPFLIQAHKEYEVLRYYGPTDRRGEHLSFAGFIQKHPATLYKPADSAFLLPYTDEPSNITAVMFRQYNEFLQCVRKHDTGIKNCEDVENKRAFTNFILENY